MKAEPFKDALCVEVSECFANVCDPISEEFSPCMPKCFDDCATNAYPDGEQSCYDWADDAECQVFLLTLFVLF